MPRKPVFLRLTLLLLPLATSPRAEDIDIFKAGGALDPSPPNVLVFLDNTSNWSSSSQGWDKSAVTTKCAGNAVCLNYVTQIFGSNSSLTQGQVEVGALKLVLNELTCNTTDPLKLNVGLMMIKPDKGTYRNDAGTQTDSSGVTGVIRRAVLPLDASRCATLIGDLDTIFNNITGTTFKAASNANYGGAMFEAFKYFGGWTNPAGASAGTAGAPTGHVSFGPKRFGTPHAIEDNLAFSDTPTNKTYSSPLAYQSQTCNAKNFLLLIGNTWPNGDDDDLLQDNDHVHYSYTASSFAFATGSQPRLGDVWARFLATSDVSAAAGQQSVLTYVLNVYNASPDADQTALLKSMAKHGSGSYYEVGGSLADLVNAIRSFFISINAQNSTFTPVAVTQSSASRSTYLNQMYLGLFRPDKVPRWYGNLKLFQLGLDGSDNVILVDNAGNAAASPSTGFINNMATSFWSHGSTFWTFRCGSGNSTGDPVLCGDPLSNSDAPDGAVVEKGGAGQMLREAFTNPTDVSNSTRKVYTCLGCSAGAALASSPFNTTTISPSSTANQAKFAAVSSYNNPITGNTGAAGQVTDIINWMRGVDNVGENTLNPRQARPSMPGDIVHSQAVVVNYNSSASGCSDKANLDKDVVVFSASNDGLLHAVQGGTTGASAGKELWAYLPEELFGTLKRLHDNLPPVMFTAPVPAGVNNKPYTLDGNLSLYVHDANGNCKISASDTGDKAWVFMTQRRGGRWLYAVDVTDKTNPKYMWKRTHTDTGFSELGQTWSEMTPILLADKSPALIFGAGYDADVEDRPFNSSTGSYDNPPTTTRTMGRGIFIVNAENGNMLKSFGTANGISDSVPSDVAIVKNLLTGVARYAYAGDTGGNIWRISLLDSAGAPSATTGDWTLHKVASLGNPSDTSKTGPYARKFLYRPDILAIEGGYALFIGSGDREKPFETTVQNRFYRINDYIDAVATIGCEGDQTSCDLFDATNSTSVPAGGNGWFIELGTGEKVVGSAVTDAGVTFFPTNEPLEPSANQCALALGKAKMYAVQAANGGPEIANGQRAKDLMTGGFPPSPRLITVAITQNDENGNPVTVNRNAVVAPPAFVQKRPTVATRRSIIFRYREGLD